MGHPLESLRSDAPRAEPSDDALPARRRPRDGADGWAPLSIEPRHTAWIHEPSGTRVLSSVEVVEDRGPEWHVSASVWDARTQRARRAGAEEIARVRRDFGMEAADEDNHVPGGFVRNLWLPCSRDVGECECAEAEKPVVEEAREDVRSGSGGDAFVWRRAPKRAR